MTDLDACYFCGTIGASLERRPVIPDELAPSSDAQRTVVLCPTCHGKLESVVTPLVEHVSGTAGNSVNGGASATSDTQVGVTFGGNSPDRGAETSDRATADQSTADGATTEDKTPTPDPSADARAPEEPHAGSRGGEEEPVESDPPAAAHAEHGDASPEGDSSGNGEVAIETDGQPTETDELADGQTGESAEHDRAGVALGVTDSSASSGRVRDYRKVLRLFNNRELPIARAEAVMLAASAYDLEEHEIEEFIDVALDAGHLVETDAGLDFPA